MLTAIQQKKVSRISLAVANGDLKDARKIYNEIISSGRISEKYLKEFLTTNKVPLSFLDMSDETTLQRGVNIVEELSETVEDKRGDDSEFKIKLPRYQTTKRKKVSYQPISATVENWAKFEALAAALGVERDSRQNFLSDVLNSMISGLTNEERSVYEREFHNRIQMKERL
ncbi:TPA: hypothetical protein ACGOR8_001996 [Streptococcus suis]